MIIRTVEDAHGAFTGEQFKLALREPNIRNALRSRLVLVESTSNSGFGAVWPIEPLKGIANVARSACVVMHMDGARLANASLIGSLANDYPAYVESFWLDPTNGLGASVDASDAGSKEFTKDPWRQKQMLRGSIRQSDVIAAAFWSLDHNWNRMREIHDNARRVAEDIANVKEIEMPSVETNLVLFEVRKTGWTTAMLIEA